MQTWDPTAYAQHGAFVHGMADGVVEWLNPQRGERILDVGCGDGQLTQRLVASGAEVTGVDASAEMAAAACARGVRAVHASAEALPFADACFDAVFSNAALHWVRDHDAMLVSVARVLRPGGRFVAEFGGQGNIAAIRVAFAAVLARHGFSGAEAHVNYFPSPAEYTRRLEQHGFRIEQMALLPRPTPLGAGGMAEWLRTFRNGVLAALPESLRERVVDETVELLAPALRDEAGNWTADYVRLRFVARR
jgi:ubiquinone/menaquinone biosynthesis C-methylase UbiE